MKNIYDTNILIEGTDCTGKTSIVNEILKQYPEFKMIKCNNPKDMEDGKKQYEEILERLSKETGIILDRGMLGECVYAPEMRGYYPDYMREFELKTRDNLWLVLITADIDIINKRFDGEFIKREQISKIQKRFITEFQEANYINKLIVCTNEITPKEGADMIIKHIQTYRR